MTATPVAAPVAALPTPAAAGTPAALPSLALTVVVTALFGVLGLVPAALHARRAERAGTTGRFYWEAFGTTFAVCVVLYGVALVAVVTGISNSLP